MEIKDYKLLGDANLQIAQKSSPNHGAHFKTNLPDTIIIHYTAGRNARESINSLCNPSHKASAHLVIGRDNTVTQLVDFNTVAWHAGASSYGERSGFNQYAIGIEIDNCGYLIKQGDDFLSWFGGVYTSADAFEGRHRNPNVKYNYWLRYTEWQIAIVEEICSLLIAEYGIKTILGHEEISPNRKIDPGPAFPLDKMRDHLLNSDRSSEEPAAAQAITNTFTMQQGVVNCSSLNIRTEGSINAPKAAAPLSKGTNVNIISEKNGWYNVIAGNKNGWVAKQYIDIV